MEELFFQQTQFGKQPKTSQANGLGQSWENINQGMKHTLQLQFVNLTTYKKTPQQMTISRSQIFMNKSLSCKQYVRQPFKLKNKDTNVRKNQLKISKSITEASCLKDPSRKQSLAYSRKENMSPGGKHQRRGSRKKLDAIEGDITCELMHQQQQQNTINRLKNTINCQSQGKYKKDLNVIRQECTGGCDRHKIKSQTVKIKNFDIYPLQNSAGFVSRYIAKDKIEIQMSKVSRSEPKKEEQKGKFDRLPIIKIQNTFDNTKSSQSIHAGNDKQKIFLLHRISKSNNRVEPKREKQREAGVGREQSVGMGIRKFKLMLNPKLSKLKLFN